MLVQEFLAIEIIIFNYKSLETVDIEAKNNDNSNNELYLKK